MRTASLQNFQNLKTILWRLDKMTEENKEIIDRVLNDWKNSPMRAKYLRGIIHGAFMVDAITPSERWELIEKYNLK